VGTNTFVVCLEASPDVTRKPTYTRQVANFGIPLPAAAADAERGSAENRFVVTLGLVMFGVDRTQPWAVHTPDAARMLLGKLREARARAGAEAHDEYHDWFVDQSTLVEEVLTRAGERGEWVVGLFEGDIACFKQGGTPTHEPGRDLFYPKCTIPPPLPPPRVVPWRALGGGALVLGTLGALAAWRYGRFKARH